MPTSDLRIITPTFHGKKLIASWLLLVYLFLRLPNMLRSISFNRTDFTDWPELNLYGNVSVIDGTLAILNADRKNITKGIGRAVFGEELSIWDPITRKLVDFDTRFSFSMLSSDTTAMGDGFAFFLANNGTLVGASGGGCLGLIPDCGKTTLPNGLVAVEFDNFQNEWDTNTSQMGIDINSIFSVKTETLRGTNWTNGAIGVARIWYDSTSKNLSVTMVYLGETYNLSQPIDLSEALADKISFGFSAATGKATAQYNIYYWEFSSTNIQGGPTKHGRSMSLELVLITCIIGGSVVFLAFTLLSYRYWKRSSKGEKVSMDLELAHETGPRSFSYNKLARATNKFAEEGKLGEGGCGEVYKGQLEDLNCTVAVKRFSKRSHEDGRGEYISEVKIISRLRHKNLVRLIGWCHEKSNFLLVYDFMPNCSLDSHLFRGNNSETILPWELRYKIVLGLASGLQYLHEGSDQCVLHRDIKSSNIMLDSNFNAKLGDFGLARIMDDSVTHQTTDQFAGTLGYVAPEYAMERKASKASDMYSFGVVALEIACGRRTVEQGKVSLVDWVRKSYENEKLLDVADQRLCMKFDLRQMECLLTVGLWCVQTDRNLRPSIKEVIEVLSFKAPFPDLPNRRPVPVTSMLVSASSDASDAHLLE